MNKGLSEFGSNVRPATLNSNRPSYEEGEYIDSAEKKRIVMTQWGLTAPNKYKAVPDTDKHLPSGAYDITHDEQDKQPIFIKKTLIHDKIIPLSGLPKIIIEEIKDFWTKEKLFVELGFLHRRGYLFYGSQGTGKSSIVHEIAETVINDKGIVFYCGSPAFFNTGLAVFRQVEPGRKIVCVFEDIDAIIHRYGEAELLSLLDGENQISGVCNVATTNYPELLDKRIVGRPRRFDRVYRIGNLDEKARKTFLEKKLPKGQNLKLWLKKTNELTIAAISETIISVFCFGKTLEEAVKIMKSLSEEKSSTDNRGKVGFEKTNEED